MRVTACYAIEAHTRCTIEPVREMRDGWVCIWVARIVDIREPHVEWVERWWLEVE